MSCGHCEGAVTEEVPDIGGVSTVQAGAGTGLVTVTSATEPDEAVVRAAVEEAGYGLAGREQPPRPAFAAAASRLTAFAPAWPYGPRVTRKAASPRRAGADRKAPRQTGPPTGLPTGRFLSRSWIPPTGSWPGDLPDARTGGGAAHSSPGTRTTRRRLRRVPAPTR